MAGKIAKIQLEMKDGVKVRTISELREHFDIEKLVGYYFDGKLKKWLETRWYLEEAEHLDRLNPNDPLLAQHLCELFGMTCQEEELDLQGIAQKNERLSRLKQYTEDDTILEHMDSVVFHQDELDALYLRDITPETIYLCEGTFHIPSSKKDLTYKLIGNPNVEGLDIAPAETVLTEYEMLSSNIPVELSDYIGTREYMELEDYVVWKDYRDFLSCNQLNHIITPFFRSKKSPNLNLSDPYKVWNKKTNTYSSFSNASLKISKRYAKPYLNTILYLERQKGVYSYNIVTHKTTCIYHDSDFAVINFSVNDGKIAFIDSALNIVLLDLDTQQILRKTKIPTDLGVPSYALCLCNGNLFYVKDFTILKYNFHSRKVETAYTYPVPEEDELPFHCDFCVEKMFRYRKNLYVIFYDEYDSKTKILKINSENQVEHIDCDCLPTGVQNTSFFGDIDFFENDDTYEGNAYFVMKINDKIYVLDLIADRISEHFEDSFPSSLWNSFQLVGNCLYWESDLNELYRVDLTKDWLPVKIRPEKGE